MKNYICSDKPSLVFCPKAEFETVLDFLVDRFPRVSRETWLDRVSRGKVSFQNGDPVDEATAYRGNCKVQYFREVEQEPEIPFYETVIFENENFLIVDKPHFLPVHPAGQFIEQTLLTRLQKKYDIPELNCTHRLDRMTAGLVLMCKKEEYRAHYQKLFQNCEIQKTYEAIGPVPKGGVGDEFRVDAKRSADCKSALPGEAIVPVPKGGGKSWTVQNRLVDADPWFLTKVTDGEVNAESFIEIVDERDGLAKFRLKPKSGKKHQLRVHMLCIGSQILNDLFYPVLYPEGPDDYSKPMQLLAKKLEFIDPVTQKKMCFESQLELIW